MIFSAFFRSLLIYYMTPSYAAGAVTESEIASLEANLLKQQLGLLGDHKNDQVLKILNFYPKTTANAISKNGTSLRHQISQDLRAKTKRNF